MKKHPQIIEANMILGKYAKLFNINRCVNFIAPNTISSKIIVSRTGIFKKQLFSLFELEYIVKSIHGMPKKLVIKKLLGL